MFSQENLDSNFSYSLVVMVPGGEIKKIGKIERFALFKIFQLNLWNFDIRKLEALSLKTR